MNKVILMGRLTADPELRMTQSQTAVCRFTVAVDRDFANKQTGEREADFINCTAWKNTAEFVSKYFSKGKMIAVEGALRNDNYTDNNGVKHYSMNVLVDKVHFCGDKGGDQQRYGQQQYQPQNQYQNQYQPQGQYQQPQAQYQQPQQQPDIGDLGDFEEIISDGDVPF